LLAPEDPRIVVAHIRIRADAPVREDTVARLALTGLTGIAFIQLSGGSPDSPRLQAQAGQRLPLIRSEASALQKIMSSSEDLATTASELLLRLRDLLSDENAERISSTLGHVDDFTQAMAAERERIADLITGASLASERLTQVLTRVDATVEHIDRSVARVDSSLIEALPQITHDLSQTLQQMEALTRRADAMLADNEDALASFGSEGLSQLGPTLQELRTLIRDLGRLSGRIESNPARFLLGGDQPEEYEPQ